MLRFFRAFACSPRLPSAPRLCPRRLRATCSLAPTRVILDGSRGTEVVLNNIGAQPATYRISLEIKRMTAEGGLDEIAEDEVNAAERTALDMIAFSPRRVTLAAEPAAGDPRRGACSRRNAAGRISRAYAVRAVPDAAAAVRADPAKPAGEGVSIALTPIYGITIPVIVRVGDLVRRSVDRRGVGQRERRRPRVQFRPRTHR